MTTLRYRFGRAELLPARRLLAVDGRACRIGARALDLLLALIERRDRVVSKDELLGIVWPGVVVEENNLQVHVSALRRFLGPGTITTVPGRGYQFTADLVIDATIPDARRAPAGETVANRSAPGNAPRRPPRLFGRDDDIEAVRALALEHGLVTVAGPGGIGKTALIQAVAHALRETFRDGVWLVELAPIARPDDVPSTVAAALQITLDDDPGADALAGRLHASDLLLVLDNCEHVVQAVATLAAAILREAPHVRLLVTSQEPLRIGDEQVYRLDGLALPQSATLDAARQAGAVALFEARARAADPHFVLSERNLAAAIEICRRLDGVALAIEFAAARVALLGVDGVTERLDERLRFLTAGARTALLRHQTLRAALSWSHALLTPQEQAVFRRLGVFVGTFELPSAQAVAGADDLAPDIVLERLGSLVDKSLVAVDRAEPPRYRLLETTRAFALEMLAGSGETPAARRRHAHALLARFETSLADEYREPHQRCLERYLPDLDNVRSALDWSVETGDDVLQIALAGAVAWMWVDAGHRPEGLRRTQAAIERIGAATPPALEARLVGQWARLAHPAIGPRELAANARAVGLWRALGDTQALFAALCNQVRYQTYCDETEAAERNLAEAQRLFETSWPVGLHLLLMNTRSWLRLVQRRHEEAIRGYEAASRLAQQWGDARAVVSALINVEQGIAAAGRLQESVARGKALLRRVRQDGSLHGGIEHFVAVNLAISLTRLGRLDEALDMAREAFPLCERAGRLSDLLELSALLAFKRGRIEDAARIAGCADQAAATHHVRRDVVEQQQRAELDACLRAALPPATQAALAREGALLRIDEAIRLAHRT